MGGGIRDAPHSVPPRREGLLVGRVLLEEWMVAEFLEPPDSLQVPHLLEGLADIRPGDVFFEIGQLNATVLRGASLAGLSLAGLAKVLDRGLQLAAQPGRLGDPLP